MEHDDAWRLTDRVPHESGKGDPFAAAVRATRMPMIVTDPHKHDNPIVFTNDAFLKMTGYKRHEIMGTNCRFLQGPETDRTSVRQIAEAIKARTDITVGLINYRKDGTKFWNALHVNPVFNEAGELQFFFASQLDVTERREMIAAKTALLHEVDHRVKNNLMMVTALITLQAKTITDPEVRRSLDTMLQRIEALTTVHRRLYQSEDVTRFSAAEFVHDIATELIGTTGRSDIELSLNLDPVDISAEIAAPLALVVNELLTNVLKHAFPADRSGRIAVAVKRNGERVRVEIADDGIGIIPKPPGAEPSFGQNLVQMMARQLRADVTWSAVEPSGTRAVIDLPVERLEAGA